MIQSICKTLLGTQWIFQITDIKVDFECFVDVTKVNEKP